MRKWLILLAAVTGLFLPGSAHAERNTLGFHLGLNFDSEDLFIGPEGRFDVGDIGRSAIVQLNPSFSYYFTDNYTLLNFSFNVPFEFVLDGSNVRPLVGPGLGIYHVRANGDSNTDVVLNILGGVLFHFEAVDPFVQLRIAVGDGSTVELMGGILFVL